MASFIQQDANPHVFSHRSEPYGIRYYVCIVHRLSAVLIARRMVEAGMQICTAPGMRSLDLDADVFFAPGGVSTRR